MKIESTKIRAEKLLFLCKKLRHKENKDHERLSDRPKIRRH